MDLPVKTQLSASLPPDGKTTKAAREAWATAQNFESVFLNSMLSPMFGGLEGDGPMGDGNGEGSDAWRGMLVDEYAKGFAGAGGLGLSQDIYRELIKLQEGQG
jgi:peptidoglycan hydrolase FlgJ